MAVIRVGFTVIGGRQWTGGRNYLLNLLKALSAYERESIAPIVFAGQEVDRDEIREFAEIAGVEVVASGNWDGHRQLRATVNALLLGRDPAIVRELRTHDIDVFFESARYLGWRPGVAAIGWIPDLQHRVLPDFFTRGLWLRREFGIQMQIRSKRMVMLSSESARRDFRRCYAAAHDRTRVVSFAVLGPATMDLVSARALADTYDLPRDYFFLPNQFWRHKNHLVVLEAIKVLKDRGNPVVVVVTGAGEDARAPGHFEQIMHRVQRESLGRYFRYLGLVPYEHLSLLMGASRALVNPSLFEGWSTTVEEARAHGVPMILSDLEVHHEQAGESAAYFDPHDPKSLADALERAYVPSDAERLRMAAIAREEANARYKCFAKGFRELCVEAVACAHPRRRAAGREE